MGKRFDLTGQKFGRWFVLKPVKRNNQIDYLCQCECGQRRIVNSCNLRRGLSKSCGCFAADRAKEVHKIDHTNERFGRLTAVKEAGRTPYGDMRWLCHCDCGTEVIVKIGNLAGGHTQSCGCLSKEVHTKHGDAAYENGMRARLYCIWDGMKQRCYNKNHIGFKSYGARGIRVCGAWKNSYKIFKAWALTHGYSNILTIDRIKSRADYCPANCHWIPAKENTQKGSKYRWAKQRHFEKLNKALCLN